MDEETYSSNMIPPKTLSPILLKRKKVVRPWSDKWLSGVNVPGSVRLWRNLQVSAECAILGLGCMLACSAWVTVTKNGSRYQSRFSDFDEEYSIWVSSLRGRGIIVLKVSRFSR